MPGRNFVLAFSGGLDTSYGLAVLVDRGERVTTVTVNTGGFDEVELADIKLRSRELGAVEHIVVDGRERLYEYCSRTYAIPMAILRLNYAVEMRYGVLVDIAQRVWAGQPVDVSMGYLNAIWQADANAAALAAFGHVAVPPLVLNVAGPELLSVRQVAEEFGQRFGKPALIEGTRKNSRYSLPRRACSAVIEPVCVNIASGSLIPHPPLVDFANDTGTGQR